MIYFCKANSHDKHKNRLKSFKKQQKYAKIIKNFTNNAQKSHSCLKERGILFLNCERVFLLSRIFRPTFRKFESRFANSNFSIRFLRKITHIIGKSLGRSSAPRSLPISSLVSLESSWQGLSNATKLDIGDARGAEYRPVLHAKNLTKKQKNRFF